MMRVLSPSEQRIRPPCTPTACGSPSPGTSSRDSSPSTNTAVRPRKCAATTAAPALTACVRSTTDVIGEGASVMVYGSGDAAFEAGLDPLLRQGAADEYDPAFPLLPVLPWPLVIAVEDHVHALKDQPLIVALERQDALAAQDVGSVPLHQILHPGKELVGIERPFGLDHERLHLLVMMVLEPAAVVMMLLIAVGMLLSMRVRMVAAVLQELRLDLQDAVEVERVAA